jgi:hypothetical protein
MLMETIDKQFLTVLGSVIVWGIICWIFYVQAKKRNFKINLDEPDEVIDLGGEDDED